MTSSHPDTSLDEPEGRQLMRIGHLAIEFDSRVLTPRPWTAQQSAWAAELLDRLPAGDVLELCAGAGHIGLLAVGGTDRHLVQVDANDAACHYARGNASRALRTADSPSWSVEVRHGRFEEALEEDEQFVLVIADPPWVPRADIDQHPDDPLTAIDGGVDGLDVVRGCLAVIGRHLDADGAAILQVGNLEQARAVAAYVDARPQLDLRAVDHRVLDRGALVHLTRRG